MGRPASFADVDAHEAAPLVAMMDATDTWSAVVAARRWVLDTAGGARTVLDVGCGPGTFGLQARRAGRLVVDVDRSIAMLGTAARRDPAASVVAADSVCLPLADSAADLVHCERVLQWVAEPGAALGELWRVTAAGGGLAVTDTDWSTLSVDAPEPWMTEALRAAALGWVPHPRLAAELPTRMVDLGGGRVEHRRDVAAISAWDPDDPSQTDGPPGLPLRSIASGASGDERSRADDAVDAVAKRARRGEFAARLTLVTTLARR
jgi:SAM-dependent methyltransferase